MSRRSHGSLIKICLCTAVYGDGTDVDVDVCHDTDVRGREIIHGPGSWAGKI